MFSTSLAPTLPSADEFQNSDLDPQHTDLSGPGHVFWGCHFPGAEEEGCKASPSWCTLCAPHAPWALPRGPTKQGTLSGASRDSPLCCTLHLSPSSILSIPSLVLSLGDLCMCVCTCVHASEGRDNKSWEEMLFFCLPSVSLILFCFSHKGKFGKLFTQRILQIIIPALVMVLGLFSWPRRQHA